MADRVGTGPISYWHDSLSTGDELTPRAALPGNRTADVVIVGAGFTGLWTAHSLLRLDPGLRVVVLERETAGFGASGRNGGWCAAAPSRWGSRIPPSPWSDPRVVERLRNTLERLFPPTERHRCHARLERRARRAARSSARNRPRPRYRFRMGGGGYTGQGVAAANAAGRGLADLILGP